MAKPIAKTPATPKRKNPAPPAVGNNDDLSNNGAESAPLIINQELQNLLPPLSEAEYAGLEADILTNGVLSPLVTWNDLIVDGHHRYAICQKHALVFKTVAMAFDSLDAAKLWAWQHQEHRRNLTPFQRGEIALQFKPMLEAKAKQKESRRKSTLAKSPKSDQEVNTRVEIAKIAGVGDNTVARIEYLTQNADEPTKQKLRKGDTTINAEYKRLKKDAELKNAKQKITAQTAQAVEANKPTIFIGDGMEWIKKQPPCDLLITDPPYSTDIENIEAFASEWLPTALSRVKPTGMAYIFVGAYPGELHAYTGIEPPNGMTLEQVLVWTYKNTLGNNPKDRYKLNWQAILFYRGCEAHELDCPLTAEQWAVMEMNAPDGRLGNRYHAWQKPMELAERLIRHSTKPGNVVYDPFACTGTFLLAAAKLGRVACGAEIDSNHATIAIERGCVYAE
ncbi:MAG: hypothetical protein FWC50_08330 [Planctomycetaceae bacterium]|nr:hypothetical protein [Planctomycetaceae bacterium]